MSSSYDKTTTSNQYNVLPHIKDNDVFSIWNYGSKTVGGKRRKTGNGKTYRRGKIGKGRRTRNRRHKITNKYK